MLKTKLSAAIFLAWITIFSGGCATKEIVTAPYPPLPLPERPVLPAISTAQFLPIVEGKETVWYCVSSDRARELIKPGGEIIGYCIFTATAESLFYRDKMRKQYELKLEAVIKSTH